MCLFLYLCVCLIIFVVKLLIETLCFMCVNKVLDNFICLSVQLQTEQTAKI